MMIRETDLTEDQTDWPLLGTAGAVIDGVGGTSAAAKLSKRSIAAVSNWRAKGTIASATFLRFARELASRRLRAPSMLWRIEQPDQPNS